jgi:hypothetical protein
MRCGQIGRRAARGNDSGQASTELVGLIVLVSSVVMAVVVTMTGIGPQITTAAENAICRVIGGSCPTTTTAVDRTPVTACETLNSTGDLSADVVAFSVTVGATGKYALSRTVDSQGVEHWYVTLQGDARAGVDALVGEDAHLGDLGEGVSGEVKALLKGSGGVKYEFADEKAARSFVTDSEHELAKQSVLPSYLDPWGLGHKVMNTIDGRSFEPPTATEYFFEGGGQLDLSADAKVAIGSVGVSGSAAAVVGVKTAPATGQSTVYLKVSSEAAAKLGILDTANGELGGKDEVVVGITYAKDGSPLVATLDVAGTLKAQFGAKNPLGEKTTIADIAGFTAKGTPKGGATQGGTQTAKAQFRIDLTKGDNVDVLADGLHSIGVPVLTGNGSADAPDPITGVKGVYQLFDTGAEGTQLTVTTYGGSTQGGTLGVKGGDGLTFGAEGGLKFEDRTIESGLYYAPGNGFVTWEQCGR